MSKSASISAFFSVTLAAVVILGNFQPQAVGQENSQPADPASFRPISPRATLMEWHSQAFDELNAGIDRKNVAAADSAWLLAELANVNYFHSEKSNYRAWAGEMRDAAAELADTIRKKRDFNRARELSKRIKDTCKRCHDAYKF